MNSEILEAGQPILFKESRLQEVCEQHSLGEFRRKTGYKIPEKQKCTALNIKEEKTVPLRSDSSTQSALHRLSNF